MILDRGPLDRWRSVDGVLLLALLLLLVGWVALFVVVRRRTLVVCAFVLATATTRTWPAIPAHIAALSRTESLADASVSLPWALNLCVALAASVVLAAALWRRRGVDDVAHRGRRALVGPLAALAAAALSLVAIARPAYDLWQWRRSLASISSVPTLEPTLPSYRMHAGRALIFRTRGVAIGGAAQSADERRQWGLLSGGLAREFVVRSPAAAGPFDAVISARNGPVRVERTLSLTAVAERGDPWLPLHPSFSRTFERSGDPSVRVRLWVEREHVVDGFHRYALRINGERIEVEGVDGQWLEVDSRQALTSGAAADYQCSVAHTDFGRCYCAPRGRLQGPLVCSQLIGGAPLSQIATDLLRAALSTVTLGASEGHFAGPIGAGARAQRVVWRLVELDGATVDRAALERELPSLLRAATR